MAIVKHLCDKHEMDEKFSGMHMENRKTNGKSSKFGSKRNNSGADSAEVSATLAPLTQCYMATLLNIYTIPKRIPLHP